MREAGMVLTAASGMTDAVFGTEEEQAAVFGRLDNLLAAHTAEVEGRRRRGGRGMRQFNLKHGWLVEHPNNRDDAPGRTIHPEPLRLAEPNWRGRNTRVALAF